MATQQTYPIDKRWSGEIIKDGWAVVPVRFLKCYSRGLGLKPTQAMLVLHLMACKWDDRSPFPSVARLAAETGLSGGQVRAHIRELERKGILQRNYRTGQTTEFDMTGLIEKLEACAASGFAEYAQDVD